MFKNISNLEINRVIINRPELDSNGGYRCKIKYDCPLYGLIPLTILFDKNFCFGLRKPFPGLKQLSFALTSQDNPTNEEINNVFKVQNLIKHCKEQLLNKFTGMEIQPTISDLDKFLYSKKDKAEFERVSSISITSKITNNTTVYGSKNGDKNTGWDEICLESFASKNKYFHVKAMIEISSIYVGKKTSFQSEIIELQTFACERVKQKSKMMLSASMSNDANIIVFDKSFKSDSSGESSPLISPTKPILI